MFKKISFFIFFVGILGRPLQLTAQTQAGYPRVVLHCKMTEGRADLIETQLGMFIYRGTYGFLGDSYGGQAKLEMSQEGGKCRLNISAGDGAKKLSRVFSWTINPSGLPQSIKEDSSQEEDCQFQLRYSKTFSQCKLPTSGEPGSQCHGEGGKDLTVKIPSGSPSIKRRLVGYAGGMTIEVDPGTENGVAVWRNPKVEGGWCYQVKTLFPYKCKILENLQEIKNAAGQIIGILEPQKERVLFKSSQEPYSDTGFVMDPNVPTVTLVNQLEETNIVAQGGQGSELGRIKILGSVDLPEILHSYNRPAPDLLKVGQITSDCNGIKAPPLIGGATSGKDLPGVK